MYLNFFSLHLYFSTLKRFSLSNVQYPPQKAQNSKPKTDLKLIHDIGGIESVVTQALQNFYFRS